MQHRPPKTIPQRVSLLTSPYPSNQPTPRSIIHLTTKDPHRQSFFANLSLELFRNVCDLFKQIDAQFTGRHPDESVGAQMAAFCVYSCGLFSAYLCKYPHRTSSFSYLPPHLCCTRTNTSQSAHKTLPSPAPAHTCSTARFPYSQSAKRSGPSPAAGPTRCKSSRTTRTRRGRSLAGRRWRMARIPCRIFFDPARTRRRRPGNRLLRGTRAPMGLVWEVVLSPACSQKVNCRFGMGI